MKIYIKNHELELNDSHFVTEGGEGKIYRKGLTAYKIYFDKSKMIPPDKVKELRVLNKHNFLAPNELIHDKNKVYIGFTMNWISDTVPVCKLFTNDFRNRMGVEPKTIVELVKNMIGDAIYIHEHDCLVVDCNEMNFLVYKDFTTPYFIDIDSYQTKHFPATAITPTIMDYHSKHFSPLTDFFSLGILFCQLFVGMHPYKGTHPKYSKTDLERRMKDNVSIFNKDVSLPPTVRDFKLIPNEYLNWFIDIFEKGKRLLPPTTTGQIVVSVKYGDIVSGDIFNIEAIKILQENILKYVNGLVFTSNKIYFSGKNVIDCEKDTDVLYTSGTLIPIMYSIQQGKLIVKQVEGSSVKVLNELNAEDKTVINDMLFVKSNDMLQEIDILEIKDKLVPVIKTFWSILPNATTMYKGVVYQNVLGIPYFLIPYKNNGVTCCNIRPTTELKGYQILEAKHDSGVLMVTGYKDSKYDKFIIRYTDDYSRYTIIKKENVDFHVPNFVVVGQVVVHITEENDIEVFSSNPDSKNITVKQDANINFNMKLFKDSTGVYLVQGGMLYKFSMK